MSCCEVKVKEDCKEKVLGREREIGIICGKIYDDLALEAGTQSERTIGFAVRERERGKKEEERETYREREKR